MPIDQKTKPISGTLGLGGNEECQMDDLAIHTCIKIQMILLKTEEP